MLNKILAVVALFLSVAVLQAEVPAPVPTQHSNSAVPASAPIASSAASIQGENLLSLGFYGGAEESFRLAIAVSATSQNVKGLLRALLAQEKPTEAEEILNAAIAEKLNKDQRDFYRMLISLQEATAPGVIEVKDAGLDLAEKNWLSYIRGLQAFKKGDFTAAESAWRGLPKNSEEGLWVSAINASNLSPPAGRAQGVGEKELQKRLSKLRLQDWPMARNYLLGMLASGEKEKARGFVLSNAAKLPKDESELIVALSYDEKTPERADALMKALPQLGDKRLLAIAVGFCQNEPALNMRDVEQQLGDRKKDAAVALILAQGWIQKGPPDHAYELLSTASADSLTEEWREAYYSTVATLAEGMTPPRYREAANALIKWRDLPTTMKSDAATLQQQIADAYFKNGDYVDAAGAYEKDKSLGLQAVFAWLKADKPDEAKRVLMSFSPTPLPPSSGKWNITRGSTPNLGAASPLAQDELQRQVGSNDLPKAMLAYLMYVRGHGGNVEEAYKILSKHEMPMAQRWPMEYLRIDALASANPSSNSNPNSNLLGALDKLLALKDMPEDATYRVYFDLEKYHLLARLGRKDAADKILDEMMHRKVVPREFALLAIERDLMDQRPEAAMELLPQAQALLPADRVSLMLLVANRLGNTPEMLQKVQSAIDFLPPVERVGRMVILARRWALIGNLDRARKIVDALEESSIAGAERDEVDFLRATLDELSGNMTAENELMALSERPEAEVKLRGLVRLAAYDAEHNKIKEMKEIFYSKLSALTAQPLNPSLQSAQEEVLKAFVSIAGALQDKDSARVREWVEENE